MEIVLGLIFLSVVTLGFAFASLGQRPEQRRLAKLAGDGKHTAASTADSQGVLARQDLRWFDRLMQPFAGKKMMAKEETLGPIRKRLIYAGYRNESSVMTYMGSRVVFAIALPLIVLLTPA